MSFLWRKEEKKTKVDSNYFQEPDDADADAAAANRNNVAQDDNESLTDETPKISEEVVAVPEHLSRKTSEASSWDDAHRATCLQLGALAVSIDQVLRIHDSTALINIEGLIQWPPPDENVSDKQILQKLKDIILSPDDGKAIDSGHERPKTWLSTLAHSFFKGEDEADTAEFCREKDDALDQQEMETSTQHSSIDTSASMIHVELAQNVLKLLRDIFEELQHQREIVPLEPASLQQWLQKSTVSETEELVNTFIPRLPRKQLVAILCAAESNMLETRRIRIIAGRIPPILIAGVSSEDDCETSLALHDLEEAAQRLESRLEQIQENIDDLTAQAIRYKRTNISRAKHCLQMRSLYSEHAETTQSKLLNLRKTQMVLESAVQNSKLVDVLGDARDALKELNKIDAAADVMDALAEEVRMVEQDESEILTQGNFDEEELLRELEALDVAADERERVPVPSGNHSTRPTSQPMPSKKEAKEVGKEKAAPSAV